MTDSISLGPIESQTDIYIYETEFKEFEPQFKFETRLKCGWFHLKLYLMFQDLSRLLIETGFWRILAAQIHQIRA